MTKTEALRMALEALEEISSHYMSLPKKGCMALAAIEEVLAQPEFIKHEVVSAEDWSEWVCPDPKSYLMKCCDCGLVHEAQFKVVRYKSETEREDCEPVDDPNVQTVFRMRRSEQWSPVDTAHRAGGLPMEQAEQAQPVAWMVKAHGVVQRLSVRADVADEYACQWRNSDPDADLYPLYTSPPPRQPEQAQKQEPVAWQWLNTAHFRKKLPKNAEPGAWNPLYTAPPPRKPLTDEEIAKIASTPCAVVGSYVHTFARAIEAAHGIGVEK